jgi:hypothetical protein
MWRRNSAGSAARRRACCRSTGVRHKRAGIERHRLVAAVAECHQVMQGPPATTDGISRHDPPDRPTAVEIARAPLRPDRATPITDRSAADHILAPQGPSDAASREPGRPTTSGRRAGFGPHQFDQ